MIPDSASSSKLQSNPIHSRIGDLIADEVVAMIS